MPPHQRRVPAEPDGVVVGGQQSLEGPLQSPLGFSPDALGVARLPESRHVARYLTVALRHPEPGDGEIPYLLRRGLSFRPVVQTPAVRRHPVTGGLPGKGLGQGCRAPELLPRDGHDVHHRRVVLTSRRSRSSSSVRRAASSFGATAMGSTSESGRWSPTARDPRWGFTRVFRARAAQGSVSRWGPPLWNSEGPLRLSGAALLGSMPRVGSGLRLVGERTLTLAACWVGG